MPDALLKAQKIFLHQQHRLVYAFTFYLSYIYRLAITKVLAASGGAEGDHKNQSYFRTALPSSQQTHTQTPAPGPLHGTS